MATARAPRPRKATQETTEPPGAAPAPRPAHEVICLPVSIQRYRVLFADGALVDFLAASGNSDVRADMLDAHYGKRPAAQRHSDPTYRIEGVAYLGEEYVHQPTPHEPHTGP